MPDDATGSSDAEGDPLPDNWLFDLYRKYVGEPDSETDVYLGFGLFFGGIAFAAIGFVLFLVAGTKGLGTQDAFTWARPAYALGMLSVPAVLTSIVVLLPVEKRAQYASMAGGAIILVAVGWFLVAYPYQFNNPAAETNYTVPIVAIYALGLTAVIGSTAAGLIANYVERVQPPSFEEVEAKRVEDETDEGESWTDAEIRRDIEAAMEETDINWGGVEKSDTRNLNLQMDEVEVDTSGMNLDPETTRMEGVDNQVTGLKQLKGGDTKTATAENSTVDDQTAALNELKKQKKEGSTPDPVTADDGSIVDRVKRLWN